MLVADGLDLQRPVRQQSAEDAPHQRPRFRLEVGAAVRSVRRPGDDEQQDRLGRVPGGSSVGHGFAKIGRASCRERVYVLV